MKRTVHDVVIVTAAMACVHAHGQIPPAPLQPVDPTVADVSPLSTAFRDMQVDFRQPLGFKQVYRIPGSAGQVDQFMRASGAVYATFPLSAYRQTDDGLQVLIPAGTVFHIGAPWLVFGPPPEKEEEPDDNLAHSGRVFNRMDLSMPSSMLAAQLTGAYREDEQEVNDWSVTPPLRHPWSQRMAAMNEQNRQERDHAPRGDALDQPMPTTIANDEAYRCRRISALLQQAAAADKTAAGAAPVDSQPIAEPSEGG